jgi:hypothetical protein
VDEVIAADGEQVAITRVDDDLKLGVGELEAGGEGDGAAVGGVERVELRVPRHTARAPDTGNHGDLIEVRVGSEKGSGETVDSRSDAASGTPDVRHAIHAEEGLDGVMRVDRDVDGVFEGLLVHRAASTMALRIA